jgi:signal transduction histidine kinase
MQMVMTQASIAFENAHLLEEQRARLHKLYRAEKLAAAGQLAASVAHEIRNPLTAIRSTVQYLSKGFEEQSPMRSLIDGVIEEVDRINGTVDELLSLTRRAEYKPERIDLYQMVEHSLMFLQTQARSQGVEIVWPAPVSGLSIIGDDSQLKQLFLNLFLNALQAMPDGGKLQLSLTGRPLQPDAGPSVSAEVSISDTGCGIPPDDLDKIFDPFFTTKQRGTGLGLATSYVIVRQHAGEMTVQSQVGQGTKVLVRFPLAK